MDYSTFMDGAILVASTTATFVNVYLYRLLVSKVDKVISNTTKPPVVAPPKEFEAKAVPTVTSSVAHKFVSDIYMGGAHPRCSKCKLVVAKFELQPDGSAICQNCLDGNL